MKSIDPSDLSRWFDAYGAALVLYARQWLPAELAEDVVQEVFIRLASLWSAPDNAKAWLYRSVRNAAIDRCRSEQRRHKHERQHAAERTHCFQGHPDELMDADAVQSALRRLPEEQREVIVLRIWAGMTFQEVSEVTGLASSTLFSRYEAGLTTLRQIMERPPCKIPKGN